MRIALTLVLTGLLVGCSAFEENPFSNQGKRNVSSVGASANAAKDLHAKGVLGEAETKVENGIQQSMLTGQGVDVIEVTVNPSEQEQMKNLAPFLLNSDDWMLIGMVNHSDDLRSYRFLSIGIGRLDSLPMKIDPAYIRRLSLDEVRPVRFKNGTAADLNSTPSQE